MALPFVLALFAVAAALPQQAVAQVRSVSGTISDTDGTTLPGVSVVVKGTTRGTTTDGMGKYQINVPNDKTTLVFSFVGYGSKEVLVGNKSTVDVNLIVSN